MSEEFRPKQETGPKHGAVRLFFEMDKKTEVSLKERIEKAKGLVRIFIHPDFEKYSEFESLEDQPQHVEKLQKEERAFKKILQSGSELTPPILIFEDSWDELDYEQKKERLKKLTANDIFLIRTFPANPDPLPLGKTIGDNRLSLLFDRKNTAKEREERNFMWQWLIEELKKLGVKKILIGGLEFYVTGDKKKSHSGCMGIAMNKLKAHFEIEISTLTWPDKR